MAIQRDKLIVEIRAAAAADDCDYLTYERFRRCANVPMSAILHHFDSWSDACTSAGVRCGSNGPENITPNFSRGKQHAIGELKRVATLLGTGVLSKSMYDSQSPEVRAATVARMFGGWQKAIQAADLQCHPQYRDPVEIGTLAEEFLLVYRDTQRIPTVHQVVRRSRFGQNTFTRKFGGYVAFKRKAIVYLLQSDNTLSRPEREELTTHLKTIGEEPSSAMAVPVTPHHRGRHLGFRAFAFAPTYENEVVSMFSTVAEELGFEILSQRPAFPDCEARRRTDSRRNRYKKCLVEFELNSSDYRRHKHPLEGCDLIVCWHHDWPGCPIEVLELKSAIRRLPGWK